MFNPEGLPTGDGGQFPEIGTESPLSDEELKSHKYISDIGGRAEVHVVSVYDLVKRKMSAIVGVGVQESPALHFVNGEEAKFSTKNEAPEIVIGRDEFIRDIADTLAHEFGHFLRARLTGRLTEGSDEHLTDEFFGFLSGRLVFEKLTSEQRQMLFPRGAPSLKIAYEGTSKGDILKELRPKGKIKRELSKEYKLAEDRGDREKMAEIFKRAKSEGVREWFETLTHYRGYEFASKVDLGKITDWKKLFSMPDAEVRKRFFSDKPDYSNL